MIHNESSWKSQDGIGFYAQEWRPETAPKGVVALVHGLGEHSGRYQHVAERLTAAGYVLSGFDLRGHGRSGGPRGHSPSYQTLMDDIQHHISAVQERENGLPCFLYGHSLGGNLVLYYAINRQPQLSGLIVTSPGLATAEPLPAIKAIMANLLYRFIPTMTMDNGLDLAGLARDPAVAKAYIEDPLVHGKISARLGLDLINNGAQMMSQPAQVHLPILLMQGTADRLVNPKATHQFAQGLTGNATYKEWEGFYHELHNEPEKEQVMAIMIDWLDRHCK